VPEKSPNDRCQRAEEFAQAVESIVLQMDAELTTIQLESPDFDAVSRRSWICCGTSVTSNREHGACEKG
jgi:hypothetical protein